MKRIAAACVILASSVAGRSAAAQGDSPTLRLTGAAANQAMLETKTFLERDALPLLRFTNTGADAGVFSTRTHAVRLTLQQCSLSWDDSTREVYQSAAGSRHKADLTHGAVALKTIDVAAIFVVTPFGVAGITERYLNLKPLARAGEPIAAEPRAARGGPHREPSHSARLPVPNDDDGERIGAAVRRAALLCGART